MRDFMTVIVRPTRPGEHRAKGIYCLGRESIKPHAWLLLVFCFLTSYMCAASVLETSGVQICINELRPDIEHSDAMLYTPLANSVKKECKNMSLRCYMQELIVVISEEEVINSNADCISDFNEILPTDNSVGCPPCEAYAIENITIFLERLQSLLEEMNVIQSTLHALNDMYL